MKWFKEEQMVVFLGIDDKNMSNGYRCCESRPLSQAEINFLKDEIKAIEADESIFIFNASGHLVETCYNPARDRVFVGRNVFPNDNTYSTHPRDLLTPRAVLAHEYYGHRPERNRYLKEDSGEIEELPRWLDEVYASLNAAINTPNLTQLERATLINEAGKRAEEFGQTFELTKDFKEILYGKWDNPGDRGIVPIAGTIVFIGASGGEGDEDARESSGFMSGM